MLLAYYSEIFQERADEFAKQHGCLGAEYIGVFRTNLQLEREPEIRHGHLFALKLDENCKLNDRFHIIVTNTEAILFTDHYSGFIKEQLTRNSKCPSILVFDWEIKDIKEYAIAEDIPIPNSEFLQSKANEYSSCGMIYQGYYYGYAVYCRENSDPPRPTGYPCFILVNPRGQVLEVCNSEDDYYLGSFHILNHLINQHR